MIRYLMMCTLVLALVATGSTAVNADGITSRKVMRVFKGKLVISKDELSDGKNDKETISKIKSETLSELVGTKNDDVTAWKFHYTAFLKRMGNTQLRMEFYKDGKQYSADKRLDGIDPKAPVLAGWISITEDEGLNRNHSYLIKLTNGKNLVVAQAKLMMK